MRCLNILSHYIFFCQEQLYSSDFYWLSADLSLSVISTIFGTKKKYCRKAFYAVRKALMASYVPKHLGLSHIDKTKVIRMTLLPLQMFYLGILSLVLPLQWLMGRTSILSPFREGHTQFIMDSLYKTL